jgi:hypothetical protein
MKVQQQMNGEKHAYKVVNIVLDDFILGSGDHAMVGQLDREEHDV